jgi:hypothetical protein
MSASPAIRHVPDEVSVVEVYGSKFLLEWLDWDVLAAAAARRLADRPSVAHTAQDEAA